MTQTMEQLASSEAENMGEPRFVISLDNPSKDRDTLVASESYVDSDEFLAFDGRIETIAYPDGTFD